MCASCEAIRCKIYASLNNLTYAGGAGGGSCSSGCKFLDSNGRVVFHDMSDWKTFKKTVKAGVKAYAKDIHAAYKKSRDDKRAQRAALRRAKKRYA